MGYYADLQQRAEDLAAALDRERERSTQARLRADALEEALRRSYQMVLASGRREQPTEEN